MSENRAVIVGVGCAKCENLKSTVRELLVELGREDVRVESHNPLGPEEPPTDEIVLPPALVVDGKVLVSGRVPQRRYLRRVLAETLSGD